MDVDDVEGLEQIARFEEFERARKLLGLSQEALVKQSGITRRYYGYLKNGKRKASAGLLELMEEILRDGMQKAQDGRNGEEGPPDGIQLTEEEEWRLCTGEGILVSRPEDLRDIPREWIEEAERFDAAEWFVRIEKRRKLYGVSQENVAKNAGITGQYYSLLATGKKQAGKDLLKRLDTVLDLFDPDKEMEILFDYVRIRFLTTDEKAVIEKVLGIRMQYMVEEGRAFYGYGRQYIYGDIAVMVSPEREKGVLLELKGKGCRQFEVFLKVQGRSWYDFFRRAREAGAVMKRIDIAINDRAGILNIPELAEKCRKEECITLFHGFKDYQSGQMVRATEEDAATMGSTLYLGSLRSEIYFCIYEKDYEQYVKNGIPLSEAETKNRFEIRLKNERAEHAIDDLLEGEDIAGTAFGIINHYVRFLKVDMEKLKRDWELEERWAWFIGGEERNIKLTTAPEPYTLDRVTAWMCRQVAPSLKMLLELDELRGTNNIEEMIKEAKLSPQHKKILEQQQTALEKVIALERLEETWQEELIREYLEA